MYMKAQWLLLFSFVLAIIVAIFAMANTNKTPVNFVFGEAELPLILVILGAALLGVLLCVSFGLYRAFNSMIEVKNLKKKLYKAHEIIADLEASKHVNKVVAPANDELIQVDQTLTIDDEHVQRDKSLAIDMEQVEHKRNQED